MIRQPDMGQTGKSSFALARILYIISGRKIPPNKTAWSGAIVISHENDDSFVHSIYAERDHNGVSRLFRNTLQSSFPSAHVQKFDYEIFHLTVLPLKTAERRSKRRRKNIKINRKNQISLNSRMKRWFWSRWCWWWWCGLWLSLCVKQCLSKNIRSRSASRK